MSPRDRLGTLAAAATLAAGVLAVGGAFRWSVCLFAALALGAVATTFGSRRVFRTPPPLMVFLLGAAGITLLQVVPLPAALVRVLSPAGHELVVGAAAALGDPAPGWMPLSLDPPATLVELAKLAGYAAFALVCLRLSVSATGRRRLAIAVACAGIGMAGIGLIHHAAGLKTLFGLYQPKIYSPPFLAPLINPNHFAALLAVTASVAVGLAVASRRTAHRLAWIGGAAVAGGTCLLAQSRGAAIALGAGLVVTGALVALARRRDPAVKPAGAARWIPGAIVAACLVTLVVAVTGRGVATDLAQTRAGELVDPGSKFGAWRAATTLLEDHRLTGIGRGAFEPAFVRAYHESHRRFYSHVENEYLQAVIDWGLVGAAALALALAWVLVCAARRWRESPLAAGALGGCVAIALHNVADFSLALPGVALPVIALLATLTHVPLTSRRTGDRVRAAARPAGVAAGVAIVALAMSPLGTPLAVDRENLAAALAAPDLDRDRALAASREAIARHPADYYLAAATARALYRLRAPESFPLANRALVLHPRSGGTHHLVAGMLRDAGRPDQALIQYALAIRYSQRATRIVAEVLALYPDDDDAVRGLPVSESHAPRLLGQLDRRGRRDLARLYARRVVERHPGAAAVWDRLADLETRAGNLDAALGAARTVIQIAPSASARVRLGSVLEARGERGAAERELSEAAEMPAPETERRAVLAALSEFYVREKRYAEAREAMTRVRDLARGDRRALADAHRKLAAIERALGNTHQAAWEEARASELSGP